MRRGRILPRALGCLTAAAAGGTGRILAQGCAMCGTALKEGDDPLSRGLSASVLFMMAMPFAVFVTVGGWIAWRQVTARRPDPSPAPLPEESES